MSERIITYGEAIREATEQEMARDPNVVVFGIGADDPKAIFGTTRGLLERFGPQRCFDTPLAEDCMTGVAIGMSMAGLRPINCHIRMDFMMLAMNQIVNIAAKARYMYGEQVSIPIVIRGIIGRSWGQGAQHSQALHALYMHTPGLKVIAPASPHDVKGALIQAIRDPDPVIFIEQRMLHYQKGPVPEDLYTVPFGKARVLAEGRDITLVGISWTTVECLRARTLLKDAGIDAGVIDTLSLSPLDDATMAAAAERTGRLLCVDNGWTMCGASAEIVARLAERFGSKNPVHLRRMGFAPTICPATKNLENEFYPDASKIAAAAHEMVKGTKRAWPFVDAHEITNFKGPF
jgi:pyruvate/2-oxoglutarate/acetoin dehydrogenase E1 component